MDNSIVVQFKRMDGFISVPEKSHTLDGGYDIRSSVSQCIAPGETLAIPTGFAMNIPPGWKALILPRSGLSLKGITVANSPGLIDCNYLDEVNIILINRSDEAWKVDRGDRIAQLCLERVEKSTFVIVDEFNERWNDDRGGGLGSTGIK